MVWHYIMLPPPPERTERLATAGGHLRRALIAHWSILHTDGFPGFTVPNPAEHRLGALRPGPPHEDWPGTAVSN